METALVATIEFNPTTALQQLDAREAELVLLAEESKAFTINGPDDKEGYKKARAHRLKLKAARTSVTNDAKDLRDGANRFRSAVIDREKTLVAIISGEEHRLEKEEGDYDAALEQIRIQKEKEEDARIQARVDQLAKFGYAIDLYDAKIMEEENFQALLGHAEGEWLKEQKRLSEIKAEEERKKKEDDERMQREREELARQKAEQEHREAEIKKYEEEALERARVERERIQREQEQAIADLRKMEDEQNAKLKAEREKLESEKRAHELEVAKREAAERAKLEEQERINREVEAIAERERFQQEEMERQAALRPDKEKLIDLAKRLMKVEFPELTTAEGNKLLREVAERIVKAAEFIHDSCKTL
jgi:hypothetical protein